MVKYKINNFEVNLDECRIEPGTPNVGYNYDVVKNAVIHYISKGSGIFKIDNKTYKLKKANYICFYILSIQNSLKILNVILIYLIHIYKKLFI